MSLHSEKVNVAHHVTIEGSLFREHKVMFNTKKKDVSPPVQLVQ